MPHLRISLLGPFRASLDGKPLTGFLSNKVRALLAYLVVENDRPHSRDTLTGLFWPESPNPMARGSLRAALTNLRKVIRDKQATPPYLEIDVRSIRFNLECDYWLDLSIFQDLIIDSLPTKEDPASYKSKINRLEQAVKVCHRGFLEGFYLENCPEFDEWMLIKREQINKSLSESLYALMQLHEYFGDYQSAKLYAHRQLELEPWDEQAHRQLMYFLARSGRRAAALAQYESCRRLLADELNVEPSSETIQLVRQIREGKFQSSRRVISKQKELQAIQLPTFLQKDEPDKDVHLVFFARHEEMDRLNAHLTDALKGSGRVIFIQGEAGSGKTTLAFEFAHRAMSGNPDLVVAMGRCNAFTGIGDPYQPFRNILQMLSGDMELHWQAGTISKEQASRLWSLMPLTAKTILDTGPNLVDTIISRNYLREQLQITVPYLEQLSKFSEENQNDRQGYLIPEQLAIFDEYTSVLQILSQQSPLLLILDDLQWIDRGSISLLFHLGRHLPGNRILIVGTYRPEELERDAGGEEHPLSPVMHELTRLYGDLLVDLDQANGQAFVDDLLTNRSIKLDEKSRDDLYRLTQGHPLFSLELLSDIQMRGYLLQSDNGSWVKTKPFNWESLPKRVEAVIAERIQRLPEICQEILAVASVEGDEFTAEVIAYSLGLPLNRVIQYLSGALNKPYLLVEALWKRHIGEKSLSQYHFRHNLFQRYVYQHLDLVQRTDFHEAVGKALEHFFMVNNIKTDPNIKSIIVQLARHFEIAGLEEKAADYLLLAANLAKELQSHQEAIDYYQRALRLQKSMKNYEGAARSLIKLGLTYHTIFEFNQANKVYDEGNLLYQYASKVSPVNISPAPHALRIDWEALSTFDPAMAYDVASAEVNDQLFSGLLSLSFDGNLVPEAAVSWNILDKGYRYLFKLREDIRWSDGTPVTAMDFEFAWKRVLNPNTVSPIASMLYCIQGAMEFNNGISKDFDQVGIHAINQIELQVDLVTPTSFFPYLLALPAYKPIPHHILDKYGESWTAVNNIQSNGPFRLKAWEEGRVACFERNPYYYGDFPGNLERVELYLVPDWQDRLKMFEANELDLLDLTWFPPRDAEHLRLRYAGEYISKPYLFTGYVGFDVSQPPFDDVRVRQAFGLAIDKDVLAEVVGRGHLPPAKGGFVPPGMPGHVEGIGLPYNPQKARRLLAEAGYPDGRGFPSFNFVIPQGAIIVDLDFVRSQWQKNLGLTFDCEILDFLTMVQRLGDSLPQLYAFSWVADYPDPDSFLRSSFCLPATRWQNTAYNLLVNEALKASDNEERMILYRQAENILIEEAPLLPLVYGRQHLIFKPWVKRFPTSTSRSVHWKDVIILRD